MKKALAQKTVWQLRTRGASHMGEGGLLVENAVYVNSPARMICHVCFFCNETIGHLNDVLLTLSAG